MRRAAVFGLIIPLLAGCEAAQDVPVASAPEATASAWSIERVETQGALVSVWGSGPTDIWAAGGQAGHGLVLHSDGQSWTPVPTGAESFLWWVYGFGHDDVYAVGEDGLILYFDGATWQRAESGTTRTLYGLWGASGDDVWIVGGNPGGSPGDAVILRGRGLSFHAVGSVPDGLLPDTLFKVYGTSRHDLVAVGSGGAVVRWDGAWHRDDVPTKSPLISLWGRGDGQLYAVGGQPLGLMLNFDGATWTEVGGVGAGPELYGVFTSPNQPVFAVGAGPRILELTPGLPPVEEEAPDLSPSVVLHSVWGDGQGTVYAVGGSLFDYPATMSGVILRRH